VTLRLTYRDAPPAGLPARDASGVAGLTIRWGDGTSTRVKPGTHRIVHSYRRPGRYRITIAVLDRAGNRASAVRRVKIAKRPAKKRHK
jgi:PKD domain-containing protein